MNPPDPPSSMPGDRPMGPPPVPGDHRMLRWLAAIASAHAALVLAASLHPGPVAWGLHGPGFLPPVPRMMTLGALVVGVILLIASGWGAWPAWIRGQAPLPVSGVGKQARPFGALAAACLGLGAWVSLLYAFRARTHFLGDGMVWLSGLQRGDLPAVSEPLGRASWILYLRLLGAVHAPASLPVLALFPVGCGVLAAIVAWKLALELAPARETRILALALVLTLGTSQLYFGYIESYAPCSVAVLAYLWAGLRQCRSGGSLFAPAAALAVAVACHLASCYLVPSFLYLVWRSDRPPLRRAGYVGAFGLLAIALVLLAGSRPGNWLEALRTAAPPGLGAGGESSASGGAGAFSPARAADLLNEALLVIPVPLILLIASLLARARGAAVAAPSSRGFLLAASVAGLLLASALSLPLPAAQDWDLISLFVLPLGILGIRSGLAGSGANGASRPVRAGLALIGISSLSVFVLVNADREAGTNRFKTIVAQASPFGRGYGYGMLAEYYRHGVQLDSAVVYAARSLEAQPSNARYWAQLGTLLNDAHRYREAIPYLLEASRRAPDRASVRDNLGIAYTGAGESSRALAEFTEAVRLEPGSPVYRHSLALGFLNSGEPDSARAVLADVVARWPGYAPARRAMLRYFGRR